MATQVTHEQFSHNRILDIEGIPTVAKLIEVMQELVERLPESADSYVALKLDNQDTVGTWYALTAAEVIGPSAKDGQHWIVLEGLGRLRRGANH